MGLRLLFAACALLLSVPASAGEPSLEAIARSSGTPDIPGLKVVWLAPWGDVEKAHPWANIIVH
ncbi:MAG TPA: N-acetylmuramoyl-L-alanine amidase, partial [Bradyrhizobium sp.]|nr:N-acetylmuramoyl-L-alanine amidase [Bradyrhizobium sp.]